jgi:hypothetical protein
MSEAEPPLTVFRPWSVKLTSPSLLPVAGPPPATVAPPHQKNAPAEPVFSPSPLTRSSGELVSPSPCPAGSLTVKGARPLPFAPPLPLWRRRRLHHDARSGAVTAPACAAPSRAVQAEVGSASAGRALRTWAAPHVVVGHTRTVHVGHALLCN